VDTVRTKAVAQKVKFLGHGGGDCTYAGQSLHEPKLPQIFVANESCFQQLTKVQSGLEDLTRVARLPYVSPMRLVHATPTENIPRLGGKDHCEKLASKDEKRPNQINELADVPIRIQRDIP
jgi:hypothetical protein